ncbi:O-antigen ligase family protein [Candidatus Methylopumilus turicensis]|uniref:Putative teichuronic acid biosynthesis protein TuaE n=1 Tax=Candidatus Methylopumilus turicensis TaxID=1581680 RepID=A0A0B7IZS3_9PROT|nr:O-antigen ligase family protein [Candidatus Methylopumilus turicensis]CEN56012.1 putative teichuronic acid biosynthesis protein TuaE [Candidatus Methylopumilus turicensis]
MQSQKILKNLEIILLSLMIISLPSLEAPKNVFLVFYVIVALIRQFGNPHRLVWSQWDSIFLALLGTALMSTLFAGMPQHEEWKGFKVLVTMISTGWLVSRSHYAEKELALLFKVTVLGAIPPLAWGLWELFVSHTKIALQIHSVGHVNHSAIYLVMIFGAAIGWLLSYGSESKILNRVLLAALSILFFISLIIGQSRGALGVGALMAVLISLSLGKTWKIKCLGIATTLIIIVAAVIFNAGVVQKEISNEKNNYVLSGRERVWNVSLEAARFHPILGLGMSNWHFITLDQLKASVEKRHETFNPNNYWISVGHSHNLYLTALVDRGIVGLGVTLVFMLAWLRHLTKTFKLTKLSNQAAYLWGGSFSAWLATFGIGFVNTTFHHEHGILACLLLGLYLNYTRPHQQHL